jgi:hypothetical protein
MYIVFKKIWLIAIFLLCSPSFAELSYRCEKQGSQNAVQFPLENYFYILYDKPAVFNQYKVLGFYKDQLTSVLEFKDGKSQEISIADEKNLEVDWGGYLQKYKLFKKEMNELLRPADQAMVLYHHLNMDFISRVNTLNIYHSLNLESPDIKLKPFENQVTFRYVKPETAIEKTTSLPGEKINYQIANKNIFFNYQTGMMLQTDVKINTAFLRLVYVCRSWDPQKIPPFSIGKKIKKEINGTSAYVLEENDFNESKGQFSTLVYDLVFRSLVRINEDESLGPEEKQAKKLQIIHALMRSKILNEYVGPLTKKSDFKQVIKKQLYIFSQHHYLDEQYTLETQRLANIYQDMYQIIASYGKLLNKGI